MAEFDEGHAFFEAGGGELEALGIIVEDFFVFLDGLVEIFLGVGDFAEIELGVGGEVGVAVVLEVVLEFGAGEIVFAAGDVAEAVGIERVGGGSGACWSGRVGRRTGWLVRWLVRGSGIGGAGGGRTAGKFCVDGLDGILEVDELLVEFAEAGFDFLEIVGEALDLGGHGVETRAGIGLDVLDGFLERAHGGAELGDVIVGLLDERLHDGVVLSDLRGEILLALEQSGDVALKLDHFASDGFGGAGADEASRNGAGENGGAKDNNVSNTHESSS